MKTQLTILHTTSRTWAMTEPVSGRQPVLALQMRLLWAVMLVLPAFGAQAAVVLTTLYSFTGTNDGGNPVAALVQGRDGYFYGTTAFGGATNFDTAFRTYGYGTVFKISPNGALTSLYSFNGTNDGANPYAGLVQGSDGTFYGTTQLGGTTNFDPGFGTNGYGTVFKISTNGALTSLYSFTVLSDGFWPSAPLVQGSDGNFYGTTSYGGTNDWGTVFKISPNGALTSLYSFTGGDDGAIPCAALVQGSDASFYGTTDLGGTYGVRSGGTVFKISTDGALTTLYLFNGTNDGGYPYAGLVLGRDGYFYGTTLGGGTNGYGTVFKISPNGTLTSLYSFNGTNDGAKPYAGLVQGSDGYFYGTTAFGGTNGAGTVFRLTIVPPPQLTLIPYEPYVILTWPTDYNGFSYAGYALQSTTNLGSSAVWTTVPPEPVVIGGQNVVINTISGAQQCYRLSQ